MDKSLAGLIREKKEEKASETKLQNAHTQNFVFAIHLCWHIYIQVIYFHSCIVFYGDSVPNFIYSFSSLGAFIY